MYHHVNPEGDFVNVKPDVFERQVQYLNKHGFIALNSEELLLIMKGEKAPPPKPVMITFDDGWLDNWIYAFPILKKFNMKAVLFVITSLIPQNGLRKRADEGSRVNLSDHKKSLTLIKEGRSSEVIVSWDELRRIESSGLIDVQSHTHTHQRWDKLYTNQKERITMLNQELKTSKKIIEDKLNKQCDSLCWPQGFYDDDYIVAAESAGYRMMFTTKKGTNTAETDLKEIRRIVIGNISAFSFAKKLFIHSRPRLSSAYLKYFE